MKKEILTGLKTLVFMTILLGLIYPLFTLLLAQLFFPAKASGSIIESQGNAAGSILIGQYFESERYFHPRPSAVNYNPIPSGATNLSQSSKVLKSLYEKRKIDFIMHNSLSLNEVIPSEMLFASASGVDPHISPHAAYQQINRVSKARGFSLRQRKILISKIEELIERPQIGFLGNSVINVLLLNLEVDKI